MDKLTPERRSANMRQIKSKDMKPELLVRKLLHSMGYRYRIHVRDLPGKPDIVFTKKKKAIFIHGCFWHQHPDPNCRDARMPKTRLDYWIPKLNRNIERDAANRARLLEMGWGVLVLWECEIYKTDGLKERLITFLEQ